MKVLQLGKFYPPVEGGIETVTKDITEVANAMGIPCDVLCTNTENNYLKETIDNYTVYRTKQLCTLSSTSISPQIIFKLRSLMNDYDIIHVHLPNPMANLALLIARPNRQRIVLHWHSDIVKQKFLLRFYAPLLNWLLQRADIIIATTPKYIDGSIFLRKFRAKCVAIPLGIDPQRLSARQDSVRKIRSKYENRKIIFSVGRLTEYKGFEYLVRSGKYLSANYVILIGGTGRLADRLADLIITEGLQEKVFLLGYIDDRVLGDYFSACDVFCLPSIQKNEAFGVVQIEAMSFKKPVVATKIQGSGVDWVNKDNLSGLNVPIKNPMAIALACEKIMSNDLTYSEFSENSYRRFRKTFTRERMTNEIIDVYQRLAQK